MLVISGEYVTCLAALCGKLLLPLCGCVSVSCIVLTCGPRPLQELGALFFLSLFTFFQMYFIYTAMHILSPLVLTHGLGVV